MGMVAVPPWARAILPVRLHAMKLAALVFAAAVAQAAAQGYPNRPVKLIVPAPAGGPTPAPGPPVPGRPSAPPRPPPRGENKVRAGGPIAAGGGAPPAPAGHPP